MGAGKTWAWMNLLPVSGSHDGVCCFTANFEAEVPPSSSSTEII